MDRYTKVFGGNKAIVIGMHHVAALPGTPKYNNGTQLRTLVDAAVQEATIYARAGVDSVMIENMHDVPYLNRHCGPEIVSAMTIIGYEVRKACGLPTGIQILAGNNEAALAVCKAADLQYARCEGFVFGHVADEGMMNSDAGTLLRYRKQIDADNVLVLTDIKKKHSSHAITADVSIGDTAHAAEFFMSDGVIVTGVATGAAADVKEFRNAQSHTKLPVLIGSGITQANLKDYINANGLIVGSYFKKSGSWEEPVDFHTVKAFMEQVKAMRSGYVSKL